MEAPIAGKTGKGEQVLLGTGDEGIEQVLLEPGDVEAPIAGRAAHLVQPAEL